jgi:hypothetical protein
MALSDALFGESFGSIMLTVVFGVFFLVFIGVQEAHVRVDNGFSLVGCLLNCKLVAGAILFIAALVIFGIYLYKEFKQ